MMVASAWIVGAHANHEETASPRRNPVTVHVLPLPSSFQGLDVQGMPGARRFAVLEGSIALFVILT
eukprot:1156975-Pelagomonas_calceolata.AAC.5